MLLNSKNFLHIDGLGLLVFYPENNMVYFYGEKKDKILTLIDIDSDIDIDKNAKIEEIKKRIADLRKLNDKSNIGKIKELELDLKGLVLGIYENNIILKCINPSQSMVKSLFTNKEVNLYLQSEHSNSEFLFFLSNRAKKKDLLKKNGVVDYFLCIKKSLKKGHLSEQEYRIVRIDWGNSQIKYYGYFGWHKAIKDDPFSFNIPSEADNEFKKQVGVFSENLNPFTSFNRPNAKKLNYLLELIDMEINANKINYSSILFKLFECMKGITNQNYFVMIYAFLKSLYIDGFGMMNLLKQEPNSDLNKYNDLVNLVDYSRLNNFWFDFMQYDIHNPEPMMKMRKDILSEKIFPLTYDTTSPVTITDDSNITLIIGNGNAEYGENVYRYVIDKKLCPGCIFKTKILYEGKNINFELEKNNADNVTSSNKISDLPCGKDNCYVVVETSETPKQKYG